MIKMRQISLLVGRSKYLTAPTNAETVIMDNYAHDIYVDEAAPLFKANKMLKNLRSIMKLELLTSTDVLSDIYGSSCPPRVFVNEDMQSVYSHFDSVHKKGDFKLSEEAIEKWWASEVKLE